MTHHGLFTPEGLPDPGCGEGVSHSVHSRVTGTTGMPRLSSQRHPHSGHVTQSRDLAPGNCFSLEAHTLLLGALMLDSWRLFMSLPPIKLLCGSASFPMTPGLSQPQHGTAIHHLFTCGVLAACLQLEIHLLRKARGTDEAPRAHLP